MDRIKFIDYLKGLCICLMIIGHCVMADSYVMRFIYLFHIPAFFFATGYLYKPRTMAENLKRSARSLLVPYAVGILLVFLKYGIDVLRGTDFTGIKSLALASITVGPRVDIGGIENLQVGPVWFLLALFWSRIFFNIVECIPLQRTLKYVFAMVILVPVLYFVTDGSSCLGIVQGIAGTFFLLAGALFHLIENKIKGFGLLGIFGIVVIFFSRTLDIYLLDFRILPLLSSVLFVIGLFTAFKWLCQKNLDFMLGKPFAFLGRYSLLLLLVHYFEFMCFDWTRFGSYTIVVRLVIDIAMTVLLAKISLVRKLLGIH